MNGLECIIGPCLDAFVRSPTGAVAILLFGAISVISLLLIIKKDSIRSRIRWSYVMVFSVLFLFSYFISAMTCHNNFQLCTEKAILYGIPVSILGSLLFGYLLLPNIYLAINRTRRSQELGTLLPAAVSVYIADKGKPFAFSYSGFVRWIVISQGMIEILSDEEITAVLLHEYGHLVNNSSFYKSSNFIYSKIPLLRAFLDSFVLEDEEESAADDFATKTQGTQRYLNSAKSKLKSYFESQKQNL